MLLIVAALNLVADVWIMSNTSNCSAESCKVLFQVVPVLHFFSPSTHILALLPLSLMGAALLFIFRKTLSFYGMRSPCFTLCDTIFFISALELFDDSLAFINVIFKISSNHLLHFLIYATLSRLCSGPYYLSPSLSRPDTVMTLSLKLWL